MRLEGDGNESCGNGWDGCPRAVKSGVLGKDGVRQDRRRGPGVWTSTQWLKWPGRRELSQRDPAENGFIVI